MKENVSLSNDYFTGEIFEISKKFPKEEQYSLTDQIRRSSRSVTSCIGNPGPEEDILSHSLINWSMHWARKMKLKSGPMKYT